MGCVRYIHNYMLLLVQVQWVLVFVLVQVVHHFPPLFLQSAGQLVIHVLEQVVDVGLELPPGRLHALPHLGPGLPPQRLLLLPAPQAPLLQVAPQAPYGVEAGAVQLNHVHVLILLLLVTGAVGRNPGEQQKRERKGPV